MAAVNPAHSQRIRVAVVITRMIQGGAQRIVQAICEGLNRSTFDVVLLTGPEGGSLDVAPHIKVIPLRYLVRELSPWRDFAALWELWNVFRKEDFDIIHTHTSKAGVIGRAAAWLARVPVIIHTPHGHIYAPASRIPGVPSGARLLLLRFLEIIAGKLTDCLTVLSSAEKNDSVALRLATAEHIAIIPNGIDLRRSQPTRPPSLTRQELRIDPEHHVVISIGRLDPVKGHSFFVQAAARILNQRRDVAFVLVGDGPVRGKLQNLAARLHLGANMIFTGMRADVANLLAVADIFVLPSLYEGFGIAAVEAMAAGLPVVATRVGGVPEVVQDGVTGILVPPGDSPKLAEAIDLLLMHPDLARQMAGKGQERARRDFAMDPMVGRFAETYLRCLGRQHALPQSARTPLEHLEWTCRETQRIACPLCGSSDHMIQVTENGLAIVRCRDCALVFVNPQPTGAELDAFYAQYFPPESTPVWARQMAQVFRREGREHLLKRQRHGRLLDVGCGFGFFAKMMKECGWEVVGVEPSPTAARWARERLGVNVLGGRLEDVALPPAFDAITLWYVLEHVPNPREVVERCAALLRPGGALIARVPNNNILIDSILARLGGAGRRFFLINPPRHLFDYTTSTLTRLMKQCGFHVLRAQNSIPRATGTLPQLLRRLGWFLLSESITVLIGAGRLLGSSITIYAEKR